MIGSTTFVLNIPMMILAYLELAVVGKGILDRNPNQRILGMFKD